MSAGPVPPAAPVEPRRGRPRIPAIAIIAAVLAVAVFGLGLSGWWIMLATERPYKGWPDDEVFVEIPQGASVRAIASRLAAAGVIENPTIFRIAVWQRGADRQLKAGEYRFARPVAPRRIVETLVKGEVFLRPITFPEGLSIEEMAALYAAQGFGRAEDFVRAATDTTLVADLDPAAPDLEGYLFPDTYQLPRRAAATELVSLMVQRFRALTGDDLGTGARARGLTVRQLVTLASLVEKEASLDGERPMVAGVYVNRLRIGMGLQCDPTVIYALKRAGRWTGNLTRENMRIDSPYNTYRYAGLPPGPIASPGHASLAAALSPADVPYLYFVSRNDGSHVFASSLSEHNANVRRYQVEYFREKRARERAEREGPSASRQP